MKNYFTLLFYLSLAILLTTCQQSQEEKTQTTDAEVAKQIESLWKNYLDMWNSGNIDGCITFFTKDVINMPSYNSTQNNPEEIYAMFKEFTSDATVKISYKPEELFVHDTMAYEFGILEQDITPTGKETVYQNLRCITVYKEQDDGSWKFFRWLAQD